MLTATATGTNGHLNSYHHNETVSRIALTPATHPLVFVSRSACLAGLRLAGEAHAKRIQEPQCVNTQHAMAFLRITRVRVH